MSLGRTSRRPVLGIAAVFALLLPGLSPQDKKADPAAVAKWYGFITTTVDIGKHNHYEAYQEVEFYHRSPAPFRDGGKVNVGDYLEQDRYISWELQALDVPTQYVYEVSRGLKSRQNIEGDKEDWRYRNLWTAEAQAPCFPVNSMLTVDRKQKTYSLRFPWEKLWTNSFLLFHVEHEESNKESDPPRDLQEWTIPDKVSPKSPKDFIPLVRNRPLPADAGTLEGTETFTFESPVDTRKLQATATFQWQLSPKKFPDIDLILDADGYDSWRPLGGSTEREKGNSIRVTATLETARAGDVPDPCEEIRFRLNGVSHEKGVCINAPLHANPILSPDLQILIAGNVPPLEVYEPFLAVQSGTDLKSSAVIVTSFDYGGWGQITAKARLKSGRRILGHRKATPTEKLLRLPKRKPECHIAECWNAPGPDDQDDETQPAGDDQHGDGLTRYEEYRGFFEGGRWKTVQPKDGKKKLFIQDETKFLDPAFSFFKVMTGLDVHARLSESELDDRHVINFNHTEGAHRVDQHGILVRLSNKLPPRVRAMSVSARDNPTGDFGPPRMHPVVSVSTDLAPLPMSPAEGYATTGELGWSQMVVYRTVMHELGHSVGLDHHGSPNQDFDGVPWTVGKDSQGNDVLLERGKPIRVIDEDDPNVILNLQYISQIQNSGKTSWQAAVGVWGGAASGAHDCVMRYFNVEKFSESRKDPSLRILLPQRELEMPWPPILCETKDGTGLNAPDHTLEPHFGPARHGACKKHLLVNDALEPKKD